jgi:predicted SprT family Zn-dependent metalloprotease
MDPSTLQRHLARYAKLWNLPGFEERITVEFSSRMRTSLGRCMPDGRTIRIAAWVRESSAELLEEVLCHEAAHAAVFAMHEGRPKPHGAEWKKLMRTAGFEPRVSLPRALLPPSQLRHLSAGPRYEHRCPVCHAARTARRPMRGWRCTRCLDAGLSGRLVITSRPGPTSVSVEGRES